MVTSHGLSRPVWMVRKILLVESVLKSLKKLVVYVKISQCQQLLVRVAFVLQIITMNSPLDWVY